MAPPPNSAGRLGTAQLPCKLRWLPVSDQHSGKRECIALSRDGPAIGFACETKAGLPDELFGLLVHAAVRVGETERSGTADLFASSKTLHDFAGLCLGSKSRQGRVAERMGAELHNLRPHCANFLDGERTMGVSSCLRRGRLRAQLFQGALLIRRIHMIER